MLTIHSVAKGAATTDFVAAGHLWREQAWDLPQPLVELAAVAGRDSRYSQAFVAVVAAESLQEMLPLQSDCFLNRLPAVAIELRQALDQESFRLGTGRLEPVIGPVIEVAGAGCCLGPEKLAAGDCVAIREQQDLEWTWEMVPRRHLDSRVAVVAVESLLEQEREFGIVAAVGNLRNLQSCCCCYLQCWLSYRCSH